MISLTKTEKRLILLYILNRLKMAVSNDDLAQIVINTTSIEWFDFQLILKELIQNNLVCLTDDKIEITTEGVEVIQQYSDEILIGIKNTINEYLKKFDKMSSFSKINANFRKENDNYIVTLSLLELNEKLIEINLSVPTRDLANTICKNFKKNTISIYRQIINILQ